MFSAFLRVCSGPSSYPHNPHQKTHLTFLKTTESYLNLSIGFNSIPRSYDLLWFLRYWCAFLSNPGQPARLSRFGHLKGKISQSVKDIKDRSHDTWATVNIVALNSKPFQSYEFRNMVNKQWNVRLLHSCTKNVVTFKPRLQMTKTQMFWKPNTMGNISLWDKQGPNRTLDGSKTCMKSDYRIWK